jgi:two-component system sensor histidine kinase KdpD
VSDGPRLKHGRLRVYLGAAPGVGKTFAMLDEGWRRKERGADVVVGFVETHRRPRTQAQVRDLEVLPRRRLTYRGSELEEMDVDAVVARRPAVVLVDELAHTNVPGSEREKRWQDVDVLLAAGIDVITTVNIQHLESLNDVIEQITGIRQRETVPDEVVRRADQIELVDMSPEALRRRMAHGNIYPAERVDAALANYFRLGNLAALRELALLWVADRVEENLQNYMEVHGITTPWETRERVVLAVTGAPGGQQLVRRAARIAGRLSGGLVGVHVVSSDGLDARAGPELDLQRQLLEQLGGSYREIVAEDVASALVDFARSEKATQLVVGATHRSRWHDLVHGSVVGSIVSKADGFDVHVIAPGDDGDQPAPRHRPVNRRHRLRLPPRRRIAAWVLTLVGLPLLTVVLAAGRSQLTLATDLLLFLVASVGIALLGGVVVGITAALLASLLANWFFVEPIHTLTIADPENLVAILIFIAAAVGASLLVDRIERRSREAFQARAEAGALARTSGILIGAPDPLPELLDQLRVTFALDSVSLLSNRDDGWVVDASAGPDPPTDPYHGDAWDLVEDGTSVVVLRGAQLSADDQRVLRTFLSNLTLALESRRLEAEAALAAHLAEGDELRTALLQAVSHDLRTPLASIRASASSLLQPDVVWDQEEVRTFAQTVDASAERLNQLVGNLLDMSRIHAGALETNVGVVYLEDVVASVLSSLGDRAAPVEVDVPDSLTPVATDRALLEKALTHVVANAVAWSPPSHPVRIEAGQVGDRVHLRVVDRGPGIDPAQRDDVFRPFQRTGDGHNDVGAGLGLAIARGFVEAADGTILLDDTPGGGLTVLIDLPTAMHPAESRSDRS